MSHDKGNLRYRFSGELTLSEVEAVRAALREDIEKGFFARKPLPGAVFERALEISRKRTAHLGTRTLDILHVSLKNLRTVERGQFHF